MEVSNIQELVEKVFGGDGATRGRLFVTCIWQERVLIVLDSRKHPDTEFKTYTDVFIPTICAECGGCAGIHRGAKSGFEISDKILQRSEAFLAVQGWCKGPVEVMRHVENHEKIMAECKKYGVYFQMAELEEVGMGAVALKVKDYYDPKFA